ncbi:MAG: hypothetical protein H8E21_05290 [Gammaproteobacteria bacterium]|nr:hypothetical protein [Gammaproteobacteria bacterium]
MNKSLSLWSGSLLLAAILVFSVSAIARAVAAGGLQHTTIFASLGQADQSVPAGLYVNECGSCHMAYPAQLLAPAGWALIMRGLQDHFGENAELDSASQDDILQYLLQMSGQQQGLYRKLGNPPQDPAIRVSEWPAFKQTHAEIPARLVTNNDKVKSFSQCNACHQDAEKGWFDEDHVRIPGATGWDS